MSAQIRARGLGKSYGRQRVLDGLDLDIPAGALTLIAGANGAGKSTLLGCLAGILRHEGTIDIFDPEGDAERLPRRPRALAYLPQRLRLPGSATVAEIMALFAGASSSAATPAAAARPATFLPGAGLRIGHLSGGQAQRVALAATLGGRPDLILLDEPFANLDDEAISTVSGMLRAHRAAGATVVLASPATGPLVAAADLVIRIDGGRAVATRA